MRLIDADALIEKTDCLFKDLNSTEDYMGIGYNHGVADCMAIIKNISTIEAEPVKRGKWINAVCDMGFCFAECDQCHNKAVGIGGYIGNGFRYRFPFYCPNCGAKVESEDGEL